MIPFDKPKLILILFLFIISGFLIGVIYTVIRKEWLGNKYLEIQDHTAVLGEVVAFKSDHGVSYVELASSGFYSILWVMDVENNPFEIEDLEIGDVLMKREFSDTLWINRGDREYFYILYWHNY